MRLMRQWQVVGYISRWLQMASPVPLLFGVKPSKQTGPREGISSYSLLYPSRGKRCKSGWVTSKGPQCAPRGSCYVGHPNTVLVKNVLNISGQDARGCARDIRMDWGHVSASQLQRILADAGIVGRAALKLPDEAAGRCAVCQASDAEAWMHADGFGI